MRAYLGLVVPCSSWGLILRLCHVSCWQMCLIDGIFRKKTCPASHMKNIYSSKSVDIVSDILQHYLDTMLFVHAYQECTLYLHQNNLEKMYETYYDRKQNMIIYYFRKCVYLEIKVAFYLTHFQHSHK